MPVFCSDPPPPTAANVSDSMAATHLGLQYLLVCPRVLCLALFSSWPTQLTCRTGVAVPTSCDQFADDTALTTVSPSPTECEGHLQRSVDATSTWLSEWKLAVNVDKTVSMEFTRRPFSSDFAINLNGNNLKKVRMQRHLGLVLTSDLRWTAHVNQVLSKAARLLHTLKRLRCTLSKAALTLYYCLYIRPVVEYGCVAWPEAPCTSPRSSGAHPKAGFQSHPEEAPVRTLWPRRNSTRHSAAVTGVEATIPSCPPGLSTRTWNCAQTPSEHLFPQNQHTSHTPTANSFSAPCT